MAPHVVSLPPGQAPSGRALQGQVSADPVSTPARLEDAACPLCGLATASSLERSFPPFAVRRCDCGMLFLSPRLPEAVMRGDYERLDYFEGGGTGYRSYGAQEATLRATFRGLLRGMRRLGLTGGRLLEVGCAYGFFLDEARSFFARRVGTDYSPAALERARGRADALVLGGPPEVPAKEPFDCAACIHVVEHVYDPVAWLASIRDRLVPGGWLVVATPDADSFWRPLMGRRWPFYKAPEHVTFFGPATLERLLGEAGLVEVTALPYPSIFPLGLTAEKLGARLPAVLQRLAVRLPGATVCLAGRRPPDPASGDLGASGPCPPAPLV